MRRSGNHAVIQWVAGHFATPVWFVNNIESFSSPTVRHADPEGIYSPDVFFSPVGLYDFWERDKEVLFHSYEDIDLSNLDYAGNRAVVGESTKTMNVLIVRDPYNLFASRFAMRDAPAITFTREAIGLWKQHAREAAGLTSFVPDRVDALFDDWNNDESYRRRIEQKAGLIPSDRGINVVAGIGSSFDKTGNAMDMKVNDRWRNFMDNEDYLSLFDEDVEGLYSLLFKRDVQKDLKERLP